APADPFLPITMHFSVIKGLLCVPTTPLGPYTGYSPVLLLLGSGRLSPYSRENKFPNLTHSHPCGSSNGFSSSVTGGSGFCFFSLPSLTNCAFSASMCFSSSEAGSSSGFCGTNLPRTASSKISSRSLLMPASSILRFLPLPEPRPAVDLWRTALVHRSICSVTSFCG